MNAYMSDEMGT